MREVTFEDLRFYVRRVQGAILDEYFQRTWNPDYIPRIATCKFSKFSKYNGRLRRFYRLVLMLPNDTEIDFCIIDRRTGNIKPVHYRLDGRLEYRLKSTGNIFDVNPPLLLDQINANKNYYRWSIIV